MTAGNSKSEETQNNDNSDACLPPELVLNEQGTDHYEQKRNLIWKICKTSHSLRLPQVFHSKLNVVKISFTWVENHSSGFTLEFDFHHFNSSCAHICDDQKCLFNNQVCNGQTDCLDKSDEQKCHTEFQSTGASQIQPKRNKRISRSVAARRNESMPRQSFKPRQYAAASRFSPRNFASVRRGMPRSAT
ncbi:hypothetical protein DPMN_175611 [Dreissena polymorpha]|uniref:Uncharacterized protein n=1 Tax=Dreissena polymorpha TaxID=45954 RepID=A0A9D4E8L3_DREPO|nr:hypothetical protein DPMN_175611 [Dreissena polymorpha]